MRLNKSAVKIRAGFTLIEVLMAVLLIAILATIAITQFTNFARDSRNAATKANLGILRNAIQRHFGTMRIRCNVLNNAYPALADLNANDITGGGSGCTSTTDVPETSDRYFVAGGIPENPWSNKGCVNKRLISANNGGTVFTIGTYSPPLTNEADTECGWVYDVSTGRIKANSDNNTLDRDGMYESAY